MGAPWQQCSLSCQRAGTGHHESLQLKEHTCNSEGRHHRSSQIIQMSSPHRGSCRLGRNTLVNGPDGGYMRGYRLTVRPAQWIVDRGVVPGMPISSDLNHILLHRSTAHGVARSLPPTHRTEPAHSGVASVWFSQGPRRVGEPGPEDFQIKPTWQHPVSRIPHHRRAAPQSIWRRRF